MYPPALQSIINSQGISQTPSLATQAPGGLPHNMLMRVVPQMEQGLYPGHFNAHIPPQNPGGMQPIVTTMVPAHIMQSMMPLVSTHAAGMPSATSSGITAPIHAGIQAPVVTAHASGSAHHGNFQQLDQVAAVDSGGGHSDLRTLWRPATAEGPPGNLHTPRGPGNAAATTKSAPMLASQSPRTREANAGQSPGETFQCPHCDRPSVVVLRPRELLSRHIDLDT